MSRLRLCCTLLPLLLLLGVALARSTTGKRDPQPLPGGRDIDIQPRQIQPKKTALELGGETSNGRNTYVLRPNLYYFTSPNYPNLYPNYYWQRWIISGDQGQAISINCNYYSNFDVEAHRYCDYDFLRINGVKYCNGRVPPNSWTSSTLLTVVFKTDYSIRHTGFYCLVDVPNASGTTTTTTSTSTTTTTSTTVTPPTGDQCCGIPNRSTRIVGGVATEVNEYPWQAALVSNVQNKPFCGGTVINKQWVLTAAHCTAGSSAGTFQVLLGKHNTDSDSSQILYNVAQIVNHPSYNSNTFAFDFSLLKLSQAIDFPANNTVAPACLPTGSSDFADVDAIVSGWGTTSQNGPRPNVLHEVTVQTMSNAECIRDLGNVITSSMLCADVDAGGKDSCQGDSGGPLVTDVGGRYTLIGVVSWGAGCAEPNRPGVYSRVTVVTGWISQTTTGASLC